MLAQLAQLSDETIRVAIDGISNWLDNWGKQVVTSPAGYPIWQKAWPIAVRSTNERGKDGADADLSVTASSSGNSRDTMDLDTLNTPAGKLVGVFLPLARPKTLMRSRIPLKPMGRSERCAMLSFKRRAAAD